MKKPGPQETLPRKLAPMMWTHLALSRDVSQQKEWRDRLEQIRQSELIQAEHNPELRRALHDKRVFQHIRSTGKLGALMSMGLGISWMGWLIPMYAIGHGFGWLAASAYLLPVPFAWRLARRMFESAALSGMRDATGRPSLRRRFKHWMKATFRSYASGAAFGFSLVFLQGLISWFMTPAPTLGLELFADTVVATWAGTISGALALGMVPLLTRPAKDALPEGDPRKRIEAAKPRALLPGE